MLKFHKYRFLKQFKFTTQQDTRDPEIQSHAKTTYIDINCSNHSIETVSLFIGTLGCISFV